MGESNTTPNRRPSPIGLNRTQSTHDKGIINSKLISKNNIKEAVQLGSYRVKGAIQQNYKGRKTQPISRSESILDKWLVKTPKPPETCVVEANLHTQAEPKSISPTEEDQEVQFQSANI